MKTALLLLTIATSTVVLGDQPSQPKSKPNVVVILSDDLGWGSIGCYGANPELVKTPNLDRLAKEGRRFTDANTTSSVCSPTRYALLTGRYCWRTSLQSEVLGTTSPLHIETSRLTIASMLKSQGYNCAAVGKWHLGYGTAERCDFTKELKPGPLEIGFDYHFGVPANHGDVSGVYVENHWVYGLNKESLSTPSPPYVTMGQQKGQNVKAFDINAPKRIDDEVMETLTNKMVGWIQQQKADNPFFVYFTPVAVHNPITPSKETAGKSKGGPFCDFIQDLDISVGRVLDALDKQGLAENTLVIFSSDNGGVNKPTGDTAQNAARDAGLKPVGPFRGGKHDVWEGGFRVPYLVRWPGRIPADTVCDETISIVDTLASIAKVADVKLPSPSEGAEDSFDISKAWMNEKYEGDLRPDLIVHSADGNFAIRQGDWKWIEGVPADDVRPASKKARANQMSRMLYNLKQDVVESIDLSKKHPDEVNRLESLLVRYRNGGYSREMPPMVAPTKPIIAKLKPLANPKALDLASFRGNNWSEREGAMVGKADAKGSPLTGPIQINNGSIEFQLLLGEADRHSLRIQTSEQGRSFRVVISRGQIEIAKNPDTKKPNDAGAQEATLLLGKKRVKFDSNQWQTVRLTFQEDELIVDFAGSETKAKHAIIAEPKTQANFIAFDGVVAIKEAVVSVP